MRLTIIKHSLISCCFKAQRSDDILQLFIYTHLLPVSIRLFSKPHLALGGVKNVSLNLTISNTGDDAYDTNIYFNFSREVFYINFWQKVQPFSSPLNYLLFKDTCLFVI